MQADFRFQAHNDRTVIAGTFNNWAIDGPDVIPMQNIGTAHNVVRNVVRYQFPAPSFPAQGTVPHKIVVAIDSPVWRVRRPR